MDRHKRGLVKRLSAACLGAALLSGCDSAAPPAISPSQPTAASSGFNPAANHGQPTLTTVSDQQGIAQIIAPIDSRFERLAMLLPPIASDEPQLEPAPPGPVFDCVSPRTNPGAATKEDFEALNSLYPQVPKAESAAPTASAIPVTELPYAARIVRTPELANVGQRAAGLVRSGFELADRGAVYSARIEFTQALETLAQTYDAQIGSNIHAKALAAGLRALQESDDFLTRGGQLQSDVNLSLVVSGHQTPILQGDAEQLAKMSPLQAVQQYLTYAQQQLSIAAGPEPAGSLALYGLGKLYGGSDKLKGAATLSSPPKAVVCHQAALVANPKNFLAANELGVLLAKFGRLPDAKRMLQMSVAVHAQSATWRNLAVVHQTLGEQDLANRAMEEARIADRNEPKSPTAPYQLQWVDAATFAQDSIARSSGSESSAANNKYPSQMPPTQPPAGAKKTLAEQMPWSATRR